MSEMTQVARCAVSHPPQNVMRIGYTGRDAHVCDEARARVRAVRGLLGYKSGESPAGDLYRLETVIRAPYVFVRYLKDGKTRREELGRFLLGVARPVRHLNGDLLDFRLGNLEAVPEKAKKEAQPRKIMPVVAVDPVTVDQQLAELSDIFPELLRDASRILRDPPPDLRGVAVTEARGPEVVANAMPGIVESIRAGKVTSVRDYAFKAVGFQSKKEMRRKRAGFGPIQPDVGERHLLKRLRERAPRNKPITLASGTNGQMFILSNPSARKPAEKF